MCIQESTHYLCVYMFQTIYCTYVDVTHPQSKGYPNHFYVQVGAGKKLDAVYGNGKLTHHVFFEFQWDPEKTHQYGHYSPLVPSKTMGHQDMILPEAVSCLIHDLHLNAGVVSLS